MYHKILKAEYLKRLCQEYGIFPSKKFGQNFLVSDSYVRKMISAAELSSQDTVIEIGPGFGALTLKAASIAKRVAAFEIERGFKPYWSDILKTRGNIEIIWGNALAEIKNFAFQQTPDYKVLANLPYAIASNVLRVLLEGRPRPKIIVVMVQKEVAERIIAEPASAVRGERKMSVLSVSVRYYGEPEIVCKVPKGNFWPAPNVDSAILKIKVRHGRQFEEMDMAWRERFFKVVKCGFANKRKQLWRNLSEGLKIDGLIVKEVLRSMGMDQKIRAEAATVGAWMEITRKLNHLIPR